MTAKQNNVGYEMPDPTTRPEDDPYSVGREDRGGPAAACLESALEQLRNHESERWVTLRESEAAALLARLDAQQWQPIATAPKDRGILLYRPTAGARLQVHGGQWCSDQYTKKPRPYWEFDNWSLPKAVARASTPTHWMQFPEPPAYRNPAPAAEGE